MQLVQEHHAAVYQKFQEIGFDPSILAFQWFVCIYSYNMPEETSLRILDLFILKGGKILFTIGLALLQLLKDQIMTCKDITDMFRVLESTNTIYTLSLNIIHVIKY
jgi:hypothetical protein